MKKPRFLSNTNRSKRHGFRFRDGGICTFIVFGYSANIKAKYGTELMKYTIADAKAQGKAGLCMLGAKKQKAWFSDQSFAEKFGFAEVDSTPDGYKLFALSLIKTQKNPRCPLSRRAHASAK